MSGLNDPLKDSYIGKVADAIAPYAADLIAEKFDPAERIATLVAAGPLIAKAIRERKEAQAEAAKKVAAEQELRTTTYKLATDTVSLVEGLVSKDHPLTLQLRSLRADLIGHQAPGTTPPPAPPAP
jgi:hypothetical protein